MNPADEIDYLKGKVVGMERMCSALFTALAGVGTTTLVGEVDFRLRVVADLRVIIRDTIASHQGLMGTPFGQGLHESLTEFVAKLLK